MAAERGKIGHNGGPALASVGWQRHCWQAARARLLPVLPLEVVRSRVRRAAELGLDYKTYAGVRATTGHDLVAFLFSSNALRVPARGAVPVPEAARLAALRAVQRIALAQGMTPDDLMFANTGLLDAAFAAPEPQAGFRAQALAVRCALGRVPSDRVLLIAAAPWEASWGASGRLAGVLRAERYFA